MRIVIDTNVLIAAFISHGVCNELLEHCVINHDVILSKFILGELKEKLTAKFKFTTREANAVVSLLDHAAQLLELNLCHLRFRETLTMTISSPQLSREHVSALSLVTKTFSSSRKPETS